MKKIKHFKINLTDRSFYIVSALLFLVVVAVCVYAAIPNPGHDAGNILVSINGQEMNVTTAVRQISNTTLVCTTFKLQEGTSTPVFVGSSNGVTYPADSVVIAGYLDESFVLHQHYLGCNDVSGGWILTGCSDEGDGSDNDEYFFEGNMCTGDSDNSPDVIYARCCSFKAEEVYR